LQQQAHAEEKRLLFLTIRRQYFAWRMVDEQPSELTDDALDSLADALLSLKEKECDLIVLHYYTGHTLKTVADMMGMSYINAKVIHKKALESLRAFFAVE
jgi:RNA polymerase sigma factor (sigma-70 family)